MQIKAKKRDVEGKKVQKLRAEGLIPASIYGPKRTALSLAVDYLEFVKTYKQAGMNKLLDFIVDGTEEKAQVLIKEVQIDPVLNTIIHVSFYEIDSTKKISADIPVEVTGISPAVKNNLGFLVTPSSTLTIRCLPKDLPEKITIDISKLSEVGNSITVNDISLPETAELASTVDITMPLAYIAPPQKEIEEEVKPAAEEAEGEAAEGAEGEKAAEGAAAETGEKTE